ncbi:glycosyltransferase family 39 protein [Flammeovirga sp. SubArs3]|uniref:ArnT family glycosyltransferase n=1 Tax=Flammeovirga sp. SubArs3 TaxID=2995316 RepID=UPI00248D0DF2|nr:glycosyltransferase family 39 protein [Flammeovirga sp. SubArs3]
METKSITESRATSIVLRLIVISSIVRGFIGGTMEFSNDEVYYWTYALYPELSHFDHPPMVGWVIQLFTFNLALPYEFFMRLGGVVFAGINTFLAFKIASRLKDNIAGIYAAFLYTSSIYASILAGIFIIPDTPQTLFWMLSLYFLMESLPKEKIDSKARLNLVLGGLMIGLAGLSKYHGAFIGIGVALYAIIADRRWLKDWSLWAAGLVAVLCMTPVLLWNYGNDFISFTFHTERVTPALEVRLDYFFTEVGGQIAYNNPWNWYLIIAALVGIFKGKKVMEKKQLQVLLYNGLPLILVFTSFAIFRRTLPHWTGPGYLPLIIIAAVYWRVKLIDSKAKNAWRLWKPRRIVGSTTFLTVLLAIAYWLINYSPIQLGKNDINKPEVFGEYDFTQDMYGWRQINKKIIPIIDKDVEAGNMPKDAKFVGFEWFPGTHIDFYIAYPNHHKMIMMGNWDQIHKYAWINEDRGGLEKGEDVYFINVTNWERDVHKQFGNYFEKIEEVDRVEVTRSGVLMRYAYLYRLRGYKGNYDFPNPHEKKHKLK